jgi:hypothetical protein
MIAMFMDTNKPDLDESPNPARKSRASAILSGKLMDSISSVCRGLRVSGKIFKFPSGTTDDSYGNNWDLE